MNRDDWLDKFKKDFGYHPCARNWGGTEHCTCRRPEGHTGQCVCGCGSRITFKPALREVRDLGEIPL